MAREAIADLNRYTWELLLNPKLALAADKRDERKHQRYAESQRLGHRLYPVPGTYTLEITHADTTSRSGFEIKPPKPQDPRWTPAYKLRGEDENGRHQDEERPHPRAGARARGFALPGR